MSSRTASRNPPSGVRSSGSNSNGGTTRAAPGKPQTKQTSSSMGAPRPSSQVNGAGLEAMGPGPANPPFPNDTHTNRPPMNGAPGAAPYGGQPESTRRVPGMTGGPGQMGNQQPPGGQRSLTGPQSSKSAGPASSGGPGANAASNSSAYAQGGNMYGMGGPGGMQRTNSSLGQGGGSMYGQGGSMYGMGGPGGMQRTNSSLGQGGGSMYGQGGSMYGMGGPRGMQRTNSSLGQGGGSMYGQGGSMYGMGGPGGIQRTNSSLGQGGGSMYGQGGSMYGMGGIAPGGAMGSGYGGFGSMRGFSGYNSGVGSMYGGAGGQAGNSLYGMGGMGGSMYGMGGSMYGGQGSMYGMGNASGMGGSMYGMGGGPMVYGSVVDGATRRDGFLARNELIRAKIAPLSRKSSTLDGNKDNTDSKTKNGESKESKDSKDKEKDKADAKVAPIVSRSLNSKPKDDTTTTDKSKDDSKSTTKNTSSTDSGTKNGTTSRSTETTSRSLEKPSDTKKTDTASKSKDTEDDEKDNKDAKEKNSASSKAEKAKPPTDTNIHTLVVIKKPSARAPIKVKNVTTVTGPEGKDTTVDEVIPYADQDKAVDSGLLEDISRHWLAGHNSTILLGASKGCNEDAISLVKHFLKNTLERAGKESKSFDVTITMGAFQGADSVKDLLKSDSSHEKARLASSPVYGPAFADMTAKDAKTPSECVKVFEDGIKQSKDEKELVVTFLVLKQLKSSSTNDDTVYLSSLCVAFAKEDLSHFTGLKEKSKSEPCTLFRYAVGGGSAAVCVIVVPAETKEESSVVSALQVGTQMRQVKNGAPRSGNVKHFVDFTKKELPKLKEKSASEGEGSSAKKIVARMETMLKDAEEMLSDPMKKKPTAYS